ncbi:hypothetical protein ACQJBY_070243 [Aegilops geniculata]
MARPRSRSRDSRRPTTVVHQPSLAAAAPAPPLATQSGSPRLPRLGLAPPSLLWGFPSRQPVGQRPFCALNRDLDRELATPPPPPPGRPPRDPRGVSVVPETPPELQRGESRQAAPIFNALAVAAGQGARINSSSWAEVVQGVGGRALDAHSTRAAPAGLEAADAGGWVTVASRRPRRTALPDAPLKPRQPTPEWIKHLCFRCLMPRHRQAKCRNQIVCRRCFQPGHRAKFCSNKPAPHLRTGASSARPLHPSPVRAPLRRHRASPLPWPGVATTRRGLRRCSR